MSLPERFRAEAAAMPPVLAALLEAELAAGNEIAEVFHSFPAPPAGACFKLARPVTTRPRASGGGIEFYERNSSLYSGEFTDAKRFFFLVEPPNPPPLEPDMDAIRAALQAKSAAADARHASQLSRSESGDLPPRPDAVPPKPENAHLDSVVGRFQRSMIIDYEKWHDGIGYDLQLLKEATPDECAEIEQILVSRGVRDWRDVEALAALNSPKARALLRQALQSRDSEIAAAVLNCAPDLASDEERARALVGALERARPYEGLSRTLLEVERFHPPAVMEALLRGVLKSDGETAVHLAAMLMFLHGRAPSSFDWDQRTFFLRFNTEDKDERMAAYRDLCARIGVQAE